MAAQLCRDRPQQRSGIRDREPGRFAGGRAVSAEPQVRLARKRREKDEHVRGRGDPRGHNKDGKIKPRSANLDRGFVQTYHAIA